MRALWEATKSRQPVQSRRKGSADCASVYHFNRHGPTTADGGFAASVGGPVIFTLDSMSRVPIHFDPWPTDLQAKSFRVLSGEWGKRVGEPEELGQVVVSEDQSECTFEPNSIWISEGYFPPTARTFGLADIARLCDEPDLYAPRSIYSHRLLQAMRSVLTSRREDAV
jgi:hypothetical protein